MQNFFFLKECHQIINHKFLLYFEILAACIFLCIGSGAIELAVCHVTEMHRFF